MRSRQQFRKVVVDARHPEVRLTLEGFANIMDLVRAVLQELDDPQDEVLGFVQRVQDLVARHRNRRRAAGPPLDLDEAQLAGVRHPAFDVVAQFLELAIGGFVAKTALDFHG